MAFEGGRQETHVAIGATTPIDQITSGAKSSRYTAVAIMVVGLSGLGIAIELPMTLKRIMAQVLTPIP